MFRQGEVPKCIQLFGRRLLCTSGKRLEKFTDLLDRVCHPVLQRVLGVVCKSQQRRHLGAKRQNLHHERAVIKLSGIRTSIARPGHVGFIHRFPQYPVFTKHHERNIGRRLQRKTPAGQRGVFGCLARKINGALWQTLKIVVLQNIQAPVISGIQQVLIEAVAVHRELTDDLAKALAGITFEFSARQTKVP